MNLTTKILSEIENAKNNIAVNTEIYKNEANAHENEFLFILKPEVFARVSEEQTRDILSMVFESMRALDITIQNVRVLNAEYLNEYNVIAKHYGVINAASKNFKANTTEEVKQNFETIYNKKIADCTVLGSLELASVYPEITMDELQQLWGKVEIKRLAGGIYSGEVQYQGKTIYIVNGFHPPQLQHFIDKNRVIVTMNLSSKLDWSTARKVWIGNTYPEKADKESLRGAIFSRFGKLGFEEVSYVINNVHLSAGPLEALLELQRFNSDFKNNKQLIPNAFVFGKLLTDKFGNEMCDKIMCNPSVSYQNKQTSLFDLTEEMNASEAIDVLSSVIEQV